MSSQDRKAPASGPFQSFLYPSYYQTLLMGPGDSWHFFYVYVAFGVIYSRYVKQPVCIVPTLLRFPLMTPPPIMRFGSPRFVHDRESNISSSVFVFFFCGESKLFPSNSPPFLFLFSMFTYKPWNDDFGFMLRHRRLNCRQTKKEVRRAFQETP